jgi:hypothetical protein
VEAVVVVLALGVGGLLLHMSLKGHDTPARAPRREMALARREDGSWQPGAVRNDDSTLTVTLVVPWEEVGERYSGLNVVVR